MFGQRVGMGLVATDCPQCGSVGPHELISLKIWDEDESTIQLTRQKCKSCETIWEKR